jgi:hypothetical protein
MELCVDREINCGLELVIWSCVYTERWTWFRVGYMELCVDTEVNCGLVLVIRSCV